MSAEVEVYIRKADRQTVGSTTTWESLILHQLRNDVGRWTLVTKDADDAQTLSPVVNAEGRIVSNRGIIVKRPNLAGDMVTIASGWLSREPDIENVDGETTWTFTGWDDTYLMARPLCWPVPGAAITAQTDAYDVRAGAASDRIRGYFIANAVQRLAVNGASAGSALGLGPTGTTQARFKTLLAVAQEIAGRNVNFAVRQRDSDRALFLYQWLPPDKRDDVHFCAANGTVQAWSRTSSDTTGNVVIIGAGGEKEARAFRRYTHDDDMTAWGPVEAFSDRRDLSLDTADWEAQAEQDAAAMLEESIGRSTFTATLVGSPDQRYGIEFAVGDQVLSYEDQDENGQPIGLVHDLVEEATTTWAADGETCEVRVGAASDDPDTELERGQRIDARRIADLEARR